MSQVIIADLTFTGSTLPENSAILVDFGQRRIDVTLSEFTLGIQSLKVTLSEEIVLADGSTGHGSQSRDFIIPLPEVAQSGQD